MTKKHLILIVEDDPASMLLATATLEADGFDVLGAGSAEEARKTITRRRPSLILMDLGLPGMDGLDFTRELKSSSKTAAIPIVVLTANSMPLYERSARAAGCQGFIAKPVSPPTLVTEVRSLLPSGSR
jgi:two-component system cell cycle response regulator DivK